MDFRNKNVIVTGGAQGIGMAITKVFAQVGANVYIGDIDEEAGWEHAKNLRDKGYKAFFIKTDVAKEESVKKLVDEVIEKVEVIDILINNAGVENTKSISCRTMEEWDRVINVNLRGPYICTKYALEHMNEGSSIVNIASTRALMSEKNTEPYSASKGGLLSLTHALAMSLSTKGIRVNAISPGWIDVSSWKKGRISQQETLTRKDHEQHPVGRVGHPLDIAEACLFLTDNDKSGFMTGSNLVIDGGMTIKMIYEE